MSMLLNILPITQNGTAGISLSGGINMSSRRTRVLNLASINTLKLVA